MQYLGGKGRIAQNIAMLIETRRRGREIVEPFCGALHITCTLSGTRSASDICKPLITLYQEMQAGWIPPDVVTEEVYARYKANQDPSDPMTAFVGFGCSFGGKWFGGYARRGSDTSNKSRRDGYARGARNSLLTMMRYCQQVQFTCSSYEELNPLGKLVYCDPPYEGTTGYDAADVFDSDKFWNKARAWSAHNLVLVSEYNAPDDFECIWSAVRTAHMNNKEVRERVFVYRDGVK